MKRQKASPVLYKLDSKGKMREWSMEIFESQDDTVYSKIISGLVSGKKTDRVKVIEDSKVKKAYERAVDLMDNAVTTKLREYHRSELEALNGPKFSQPMKAQTYKPGITKLPPSIYTQPKINGLRCTYDIFEDTMYTKTGLTYNIPHVHKELEALSKFMGNVELDGELFIPGLPVASIRGAAETLDDPNRQFFEYHIYDVITQEPFEVRLERILDGIKKYTEFMIASKPIIKYVPTYLISLAFNADQKLLRQYEYFLYLKYEGMMLRDSFGPYEQGKQSKYLLKWKPVKDGEFEVVHVTYENRVQDGVSKKLVEFHCKEPKTGKMFKTVPKWNVDRRFQFYLDNRDTPLTELLAKLDPLNVEWREETINGIPFHAVAIDFRPHGY